MSDDIAKRVAAQYLRKKGCLINDPTNLPSIGSVVERIVTTEAGADIYFKDGSWVSASVEQPQVPQTGGCGCGGSCGGSCGCGSKKAAESINLVAVVRNGEFLGAKDASRMGARDAGVWQFSGIERPFDMYLLREVPMRVAVQLVDFGTPASRIKDGKKLWRLASKFAEKRPFKRV